MQLPSCPPLLPRERTQAPELGSVPKESAPRLETGSGWGTVGRRWKGGGVEDRGEEAGMEMETSEEGRAAAQGEQPGPGRWLGSRQGAGRAAKARCRRRHRCRLSKRQNLKRLPASVEEDGPLRPFALAPRPPAKARPQQGVRRNPAWPGLRRARGRRCRGLRVTGER